MDAIKQQLLRIQQQISGLSASQKMLTASLVVIMIMTMFYWARFAATAEMEPLLDQSLSAESLSPIKAALAAKSIKYEVTGDRIMVPADKRMELIADLAYAQLLPRDAEDGFEKIFLAHRTPFDSQQSSEQLLNRSREATISGIITRWPGVKQATVIIDGTNKRNPTRSIQPTAAVAITLKSGEQPNKKIAAAVADLLAGAQAGLMPENVKVTVNGQAMKMANPNDPLAGGGDNPILEQKRNYERDYADKILNVIQYIPNAYATVSVELNTKTMQINQKDLDKKNVVEAVKKQTTVSEENTMANPSAEPGMTANTGVTLNETGATAPGQKSTSDKNETEFTNDIGFKTTSTIAPAGDAVAVAAAVRVPDSYFISIWKRKNPTSTTEPSDSDLDTLVKEHLAPIREAVKAATAIKDDNAISVARYIDVSQPITGSEVSAAGLASLSTGFGFGAKEIAIGVLAVVSLFMMSMMVRKSIPQPVLPPTPIVPPAENDPPEGPITAAADLVGEVGEGGLLLTGHEMTDGDLESRQVIEQVGTMVKENPDVAANLVKRWLNRD